MQFPAGNAITNVFKSHNPFADASSLVILNVNAFLKMLILLHTGSTNLAANLYRFMPFWHILPIFGMWTAGKSTISDGGGCNNKNNCIVTSPLENNLIS
jgi:hypothetical protein